MDGFEKAFTGFAIGMVLLNIAFWTAIVYVAYRVLTHFGIL